MGDSARGLSSRPAPYLPSLSARSHASSRSATSPLALMDGGVDPLDDPMLLELAEVVGSMRTANSTVIMCTRRLNTRRGQHFVNALRVRGHRVLPVADVRVFSKWTLAPRAFGVEEGIVLVADWRELSSCHDVLREASSLGSTQFDLLGAVVL